MRRRRQKNTQWVIPLIATAGLVIFGIIFLLVRQNTSGQSRYFPETGYVVREPFLSVFEEQGGIGTFGYPLTDAYRTSDDTLAQTFQRAQLQLTVRGVALAPIGKQLHLGDGQTHPVAPEFESFYQSYGGETFFGRPLSGWHDESGLLVQDFERVRIVRDQLGEVRLANLGSTYLAVYPPPGTSYANIRGTASSPPDISPRVSIEQPTVKSGDQQTIYLYVKDEDNNPVAGVQALAVLYYDNSTAEVELAATDSQGLSSAAFIVPPASPGTQVVIEMHLLYGETSMTIETTYFQWW